MSIINIKINFLLSSNKNLKKNSYNKKNNLNQNKNKIKNKKNKKMEDEKAKSPRHLKHSITTNPITTNFEKEIIKPTKKETSNPLYYHLKTEKILAVPEEQLKEYKEAFDLFDREQTGLIGPNEIYSLLKNFGNPTPKKEIDQLMADFDEDGDGKLSFDEFVTFLHQSYVTLDEMEAVIRAFKTFDRNNSGEIDLNEFKFILEKLGHKLPDDVVKLIFYESKLNENGKMDYNEFVNFWSKTNPL